MWYLVKFVDDGIWYVCPQSRLKNSKGQTLVKWPQDRKWYRATIQDSGGKRAMELLYERKLKEMWYLVQFVDDSIWYVCPEARLKNSEGQTLVKWPQNGKWYRATIQASGGKMAMELLYEKKLKEPTRPKIPDLQDDKSDLNKRQWRRFCNVDFKTDNLISDSLTNTAPSANTLPNYQFPLLNQNVLVPILESQKETSGISLIIPTDNYFKEPDIPTLTIAECVGNTSNISGEISSSSDELVSLLKVSTSNKHITNQSSSKDSLDKESAHSTSLIQTDFNVQTSNTPNSSLQDQLILSANNTELPSQNNITNPAIPCISTAIPRYNLSEADTSAVNVLSSADNDSGKLQTLKSLAAKAGNVEADDSTNINTGIGQKLSDNEFALLQAANNEEKNIENLDYLSLPTVVASDDSDQHSLQISNYQYLKPVNNSICTIIPSYALNKTGTSPASKSCYSRCNAAQLLQRLDSLTTEAQIVIADNSFNTNDEDITTPKSNEANYQATNTENLNIFSPQNDNASADNYHNVLKRINIQSSYIVNTTNNTIVTGIPNYNLTNRDTLLPTFKSNVSRFLRSKNNSTSETEKIEISNNVNLDYKSEGSPKPFAVVSPFKDISSEEENEPFVCSGSEYVLSSSTSDSETEICKPKRAYRKPVNCLVKTRTASTSIYKKFKEQKALPDIVIKDTKPEEKNDADENRTNKKTDNLLTDFEIDYISEPYAPEYSSEIPIQEPIVLQPGQVENVRNNSILTKLTDNPILKPQATLISHETCNIISETVVDSKIEQEVIIDYSKKNEGKRIRDKVHCCYFCHNLYKNNLPRHYQRVHANEIEVAQIFAITDAKKRREKLLHLERCGDFYHNCEVLTIKKGELILARRPSENELQFTKYIDYGPCPQCLGFMLKRHIWHHLKYTCNINKNQNNSNNETENLNDRLVIAESTALLNGILSPNLSKQFNTNIINKFIADEISEVSKGDPSIVRYGAFLYEKYSTTQSELIRQSMRQLARLIIEVRRITNKLISLSDLLCPENFDTIVLATKQLCISSQENTSRPEFGIPSLALKLGYSLKKCVAIERGQALRRGELNKNKKLLSFLAILKIEWRVRISSNAKATLESRKLNAIDLLPLTSDLLKLRNYLDTNIQKTRTEILQCFTSNGWVKLTSLTLVRIILFNKRRSGEASKITMQQYATRPSWENQGTEEMKNSLTSFERQLASKLTLVQVVGKRGRRVPIIISREVKETLDQLILTRVQAGVRNENPYIFAIPGTNTSHIRGHDCIKKWCIEAELQSSDLVTGTKLRKYVATVCQVFDLTENEQDWLARHLGHDIRVHREFYRLQENAVELTKVSRLLLAVDQGEAKKFSGKKLKDINIEDLPAIEEEQEPNDFSDQEANDDENVEHTVLESMEELQIHNEHSILSNTRKLKEKGKKQSKRTYKKTPWSNEEKEVVLREMRHLIKKKSLPGKDICSMLIEKYPVLANRKWTDVKFFVKNYLSKKR